MRFGVMALRGLKKTERREESKVAKQQRSLVNMPLLWRQIALLVLDVIVLVACAVLAVTMYYEFNIREPGFLRMLENVLKLMPITIPCALLIFNLLDLYTSIWSYVSEQELVRVVIACVGVSAAWWSFHKFFDRRLPVGFAFFLFFLLLFSVSGIRVIYRVLRHVYDKRNTWRNPKRRTLVIGAGEAGAAVVREMQQSALSENRAICIVDDDISKQDRTVYGVKVAGTLDDIEKLAREYRIEEIILAIPSMPMKNQRELLNRCKDTGCQLKTLPALYQLVNGEVSIQKIRRVEIEDLLAREAIEINMDEITGYVSGKTILVTGGGGSIGSELCRQLAAREPARLIIFDVYENNAYAIQQELLRAYPNLELVVLIGSVRDRARVDLVFETYHPQIVYHAAAHKHVPLMETSPNESIKNNVFGTKNVAEAADAYGAESFILISTDKAVNPTNVMGASKRICEMIVCNLASSDTTTRFACVRFGNVLGSNGSVIPLFSKQIEMGGPVTVTHKDIIRYFMTIPEAVSLVLQAGAYAKRGEIFVLDMGEPVRIDDLARNMIRLSGFRPDVDIAVEYTGLRPGEKLYEELLLSEEGLEKTPNNLIFIGHPEKIDSEVFEEKLEALRVAAEANSADVRRRVKELVSTYNYKE